MLATFGVDRLFVNRDVHEVAFVLISVVLAYIFLPDVGPDIERAVGLSSLWLRDATQLRTTVDSARLRLATVELLRSFLSPANANAAWVFGCLPFLTLEEQPERVLSDFRYEIHVDPADDARTYTATTSLSARRILPTPSLWVGLARTTDALVDEYITSGCILRELVPVEQSLWDELAFSGKFAATLTVERQRYVGRLDRQSNDLIRLLFDEVPVSVEPRETTLLCKFVIPRATRMFPVKLASYFCHGRTEISFTIAEPVRTLGVFVSMAGLQPQDERGESADIRARSASIKVRSKADALLWPGSGVVFVWTLPNGESA
ncbi:MAG: hypothetical protein HY071_03170 [Chloroflexi bacterium]|nr:hypothetical protein [Chloroflexota bacterium]